MTTDEFVSIKVIEGFSPSKEEYYNEVTTLKKIGKAKYCCYYIDNFETKDGGLYIVKSLYDDYFSDNLFKNLFKNNYKDNYAKLPINLIKKIFSQLNIAFKELKNNNLFHGDFFPTCILVKYTNEDKTNFDSFLSGYGITEEFNPNIKCRGEITFQPPEGCVKKNSDLYMIGLTIFVFYFGREFYGDKILEKYLEDKLEFNKPIPIKEDKQLEDLLNKLIVANPDERITWEEYFNHPFFKQYDY